MVSWLLSLILLIFACVLQVLSQLLVQEKSVAVCLSMSMRALQAEVQTRLADSLR